MSKKLSVLLASAASGGTLAAARDLGRRGFDVSIVSSSHFDAAAWSRYASRIHSAPPESRSQQFLERLLAIGAADPGQILLPTSDQTAWLYVEHAAALERYFRLHQSSIGSFRRILDKKLLAEAAISAGLHILPSWSPQSLDEVSALAPNLPYPILIKPRTHVQRLRNNKGLVVSSASELMRKYHSFVDREDVRTAVNPVLSQANLPILQQFVRIGSEGVYSVTGFIDRTGELFVTRVASKVFQRFQPVGVGVCFEARPSAPALSDAVRRLCRELEYHGIFEVEFVRFQGHWAVIDFNPRLFSQVGLDIRRAMPLPLFACLEAAGEASLLNEAVRNAQAENDSQAVFCDRFTLNAILLAQTLTAKISHADRAYWRAWMKRHAGHGVDFAVDKGDPVPGAIHMLSEIYLGLKSLPRFMRSTSRTSPLAVGLPERETS